MRESGAVPESHCKIHTWTNLFGCLVFMITAVALVHTPSFGQEWKVYPYQPDNSVIQFPADEGHHKGQPVEWWYMNGHLKGQETGHDYAFMVSYFYYSFLGYDGFRILDLFDLTTGEHEVETYPCNYSVLAEDSLHIVAVMSGRLEEYWLNRTDPEGNMIPFEYSLHTAMGGERLDITCVGLKPPLIVGDSGYFDQGDNSYTYYYSQTALSISGNMLMNGIDESVEGTGWIDRQYGSFNPYQKEEYEWFSLQLSNGMEVNLWNIFTPDNRIPYSQAYRICNVMFQNNETWKGIDFLLERLNFTFTGAPEVCYGSRWHLVVEELEMDLTIETLGNDHLVSLPFRFFEGPISISGTVNGQAVTGKGFGELLHTYDRPDLAFAYPESGMWWNSQEPVSWSLNNPDDGNPLVYELQLLNRNGSELVAIGNLGDTNEFAFNPELFVSDTVAGLKLLAYSADSTITGESTVFAKIMPKDHVFYRMAGESISLDATLSGDGGYDYQWIKNGVEMAGENNSILDLDNLTEADNGIYCCMISGIHYADTTVPFYIFTGTGEMFYQHVYICEGDSFYTGSRWIDEEGIFIDSLKNVSGFDSLIVSEIYTGLCTAADGLLRKAEIKVFTDLTSNYLNIEMPDPFSGQIYVIDMQGRMIINQTIRGENLIRLDQSRMKPGFYILILNGNWSYVTKFIKMQQ